MIRTPNYAVLDWLVRYRPSQAIPKLVEIWLDDYDDYTPQNHVVETDVSDCSYLFDIPAQRLVAAWAISQGRHGGGRDKTRMAGFPLSAGKLYHRGHVIPHTLGGGTDINLVPQLGKINIGSFRPLEKRAVATPGAHYFTYWDYRNAAPVKNHPGQTPTRVDQGCLIVGQTPDIRAHGN